MESETQSTENTQSVDDSVNQSAEDMAPPEGDLPTNQNDSIEEQYETLSLQNGKVDDQSQSDDGEVVDAEPGRVVSTDDGGIDNAEDGEILEDGEVVSDQEGDGEINDEDGEVDNHKSSSNKTSPSKSKSHKDEERRSRGKNKRERHSKRRRSQDDNHKDKKQKKKRHREYVDYDKAGEDYEQGWPGPNKREKSDRKGDRSPPPSYHSPSHDSHGEDRHKQDKDRRGSGEGRHHSGSGRDKDRSRDQNRDKRNKDSRERSRERDRKDKDRHDKHDHGKNKKDRHNRDSKESRGERGKNDYDSPPGLYDSPSDEENDKFGNKKPTTMMSMVEGEYLDPSMITNDNEALPCQKNKKAQKKKEWQERRRQRELDNEFEEEAPAKKKPLHQTPMEERPICWFYKEGKCHKGSECPFNHQGLQPPKRLELCRFHIQSFCRNEEECPYMHREFPCKYFHTGSTCYQGEKCKFSHEPLTAETDQALKNALNDNNHMNEDFNNEEGHEGKKRYKKGLLGDGPPMSQQQIEVKLEELKHIPSIFDIETFAPGESPRKPPNMIRPQGFYQDNNMSSPQGGPNMRFNGPNQGTPPRPPFMPGMDLPPPGMQGPPMGGPGLMGPAPGMGPPPGMPNMQGPPPMGPPMSQAAAIVGAILRAAPMLQQYRGPSTQMPPTSMANDQQNFMVPPPNMGQGQMLSPNSGMMSPGSQDGNMMQALPPNMMGMMPDFMGQTMAPPDQQGDFQGQDLGEGQNQDQSGAGHSRDPRSKIQLDDPRMTKPADMDVDMSDMGDVDMRAAGTENGGMGDTDLRQDVDHRQDDNHSQGNTTPQQDWDEDDADKKPVIADNADDMDIDIPDHLPPKQREMFLRIRQHTMKMKLGQGDKEKKESVTLIKPTDIKVEDDKWYSSDEDEDVKPNINNILSNLSQPTIKQEPLSPPQTATAPSSGINVMQMINAIKNQTPATTPATNRPQDPRKQHSVPKHRPPTIINSNEGDCPWRLFRVLYIKQRIPSHVDLNDEQYKTDPRVQQMLKREEMESGKIIDHSKTPIKIKSEPIVPKSEPVLPLLDPKIFLASQTSIPRPELAPFVDPIKIVKNEPVSQPEPPKVTPRPMDPRVKANPEIPNKPFDPRVQRVPSHPGMAMHSLPARPLDPRLSRQDSNSGVNNAQGPMSGLPRAFDPRLGRQNSRDGGPAAKFNSVTTIDTSVPPPGMDPRQLNRQTSDPRLTRTDTLPVENVTKPLDPRLGRVMDTEPSLPSVQRQLSQPSTMAEKDAASDPPKPKIDYRNDPRFKRKHISESNLSPESAKRFTGVRKTSTEYSSPLGSENSKQEGSEYNSYNRPRPTPTQTQNSSVVKSEPKVSIPAPTTDISTHDILDSLQIMPPPQLDQLLPDKNLKDIFKTIDPTASPFC